VHAWTFERFRHAWKSIVRLHERTPAPRALWGTFGVLSILASVHAWLFEPFGTRIEYYRTLARTFTCSRSAVGHFWGTEYFRLPCMRGILSLLSHAWKSIVRLHERTPAPEALWGIFGVQGIFLSRACVAF
jgi:hypothetical protein